MQKGELFQGHALSIFLLFIIAAGLAWWTDWRLGLAVILLTTSGVLFILYALLSFSLTAGEKIISALEE